MTYLTTLTLYFIFKATDIHEKKKIAHNNINIFHSHENKTQKILTYMSYIKEGKMEKKTYIPTLLRFPAFKKSQYEQSENDGQVIISEKEKHRININQM